MLPPKLDRQAERESQLTRRKAQEQKTLQELLLG